MFCRITHLTFHYITKVQKVRTEILGSDGSTVNIKCVMLCGLWYKTMTAKRKSLPSRNFLEALCHYCRRW